MTYFLSCQGSHNDCALSSPRSRGRGRGRRRFGTGRRPGRPPKFLCLDPPLEPSGDKTAVREIWIYLDDYTLFPKSYPRGISYTYLRIKTLLKNIFTKDKLKSCHNVAGKQDKMWHWITSHYYIFFLYYAFSSRRHWSCLRSHWRSR